MIATSREVIAALYLSQRAPSTVRDPIADRWWLPILLHHSLLPSTTTPTVAAPTLRGPPPPCCSFFRRLCPSIFLTMVQYWRAAGVSYLRYSNLCADALRSALKPEAAKKGAVKTPFSMTKSTWESGKPVARGMFFIVVSGRGCNGLSVIGGGTVGE